MEKSDKTMAIGFIVICGASFLMLASQSHLLAKKTPVEISLARSDTTRDMRTSALNRTNTAPKAFEVPSGDWILDILTAGLVAVGILQIFVFAVQARALKASIATERPHIFVYGPSEIKEKNYAGEDYYPIKYNVANFGRVPAIITRAKIGILSPAEFPGEPEDIYDWHTLRQNNIFIVGENREESYNFPFEEYPLGGAYSMDSGGNEFDYWTPLTSDPVRLQIIIEYDGPTTKGHRTIATWIFSDDVGRFLKYEPNNKNRQRDFNQMD